MVNPLLVLFQNMFVSTDAKPGYLEHPPMEFPGSKSLVSPSVKGDDADASQ